ncbi:MAG: hypothetical protein ACK4L7_00020 [Flavobacteriales bacterium]
MGALPKDWAYSPALDAELKQYLLLAYLQRVQACFGESKLYPHLSELDEHLAELLRIRQELERIADAGGEVVGFDPSTGRAVHDPLPRDPWLGEQVIGMAVPGLREALAEGHALREEIARRIQFAPVGLTPLKPTAGWLLLRSGRTAQAYRYEVSLVCAADAEHDGLRRVRTRYVADYAMGIAVTFERIKTDLIERHPDLPNPAVFAFETDLSLPRIETYMPVAKQLLYEVIRETA